MDTTKQNVLAKYGLTQANFIARGMEAEVYRYGNDNVLKLYPSTASLTNLQHLQLFYASLDRSRIPYILPSISHLADQGAYIVTIESLLVGQPLTTLLQTTPPSRFERLFRSYVDAVVALAQIPMPPITPAYKLFDPTHLSSRRQGDWYVFLRRWLTAQLQTLAPYFVRDVAQFDDKLAQIDYVLNQPYHKSYSLIHGDIFPGNLLVASSGQVLALLDFGMLTMYGDPLLDAATAWVFFDMYDELQSKVRQRLLPFFLERLGEQARGQLYRYVLLYSLLSANMYSSDCTDGHYRWCVANLNTDEYWKHIE